MDLRLSKLICTIACYPIICCAIILSGCDAPPSAKEEPKQESIIGKKTQDVGEYDPNGDAVIADLQVDSNANPLSAATGAYKFAAGRTSELAVQQAVELYNAEHGHYPKDHAEFMENIVKRNNIQFPVLPGKRRYQYDVKNHKLVFVESAAEGEAENQKPAQSEN